MCDSDAFGLSEAVRKGLLYEGQERNRPSWKKYARQLNRLPKEMVELFTRIKYLPSKEINELVIHYAIIAAKSLTLISYYLHMKLQMMK